MLIQSYTDLRPCTAHVSNADSSQLRDSKVRGGTRSGGITLVANQPSEKENEMKQL